MLRSIILALLTSGSLILAFPKTDYWFLSWFAFIPLLFAIDGKSQKTSFLLSYLCGAVFFVGTLYWFIHVTYVGALLLSLYCALYFGLLGSAYYFCRNQTSWQRLLFLSSFWVVCEYARAHLLSGFGWVLLGQSQYKNLQLIQIADLTGVFGVSFVVMMVNVTLKQFLSSFFKKDKSFALSLFLTTITFLGVLYYGDYQFKQERFGQTVSVSVVQANIPQEMKWHKPFWPDILDKYQILTQRAALEKPDLIIWPETSFPGYLGEHDELFKELQDFVEALGIPLLLGTVVKAGEEEYYNSAVLIDQDGALIRRYDKLHLVPFGEYIPFRQFFPLLSAVVPIADFTSGKDFIQFPVPGSELKFATLICFEDSIPYLSRTFTQKGSNLLVNITNDAWFEDTKAPFLHLQTAIFRSIENRRALIRAANTGISAFIDATGQIRDVVKNQKGKPTYVLGFIQGEITLLEGATFYTRFGDMFSFLCAAYVFFTFLSSFFRVNSKSQET